MLGTDREPGIMARALNELFYEMDRTKEDMKYKVSMSYLEVRNIITVKVFNVLMHKRSLRPDMPIHLNFDSTMDRCNVCFTSTDLQ